LNRVFRVTCTPYGPREPLREVEVSPGYLGFPGVIGGLEKIYLHNLSFVQIDFITHPGRNFNGSAILNYTIIKVLRELGINQH